MAVVVTVVMVVAGCGSVGVASGPPQPVDELAAHDGKVCPSTLPIGNDPSGYGFGEEADAKATPTFLVPQEAWVCRYASIDAGQTSSGGMRMEWSLAAPARALDAPAVTRLRTALVGLRPFPAERGCNSDLGPRWMVVYSHGGDLTGIVVDDYGCSEVRLSEEPFETPPGALDQSAMVGGVLDGGQDLLDQLALPERRP